MASSSPNRHWPILKSAAWAKHGQSQRANYILQRMVRTGRTLATKGLEEMAKDSSVVTTTEMEGRDRSRAHVWAARIRSGTPVF